MKINLSKPGAKMERLIARQERLDAAKAQQPQQYGIDADEWLEDHDDTIEGTWASWQAYVARQTAKGFVIDHNGHSHL